MPLALEKGLPSNLEAERFILGSIQNAGNDMFASCDTALSADDFALEKHRRIYSAMRGLDEAGQNIGRVEVANELIRLNQLESVDGLSYLTDLDTGLPLLASIDSYVRIVREKSILRQIALAAHNLMERALLADDDPAAILTHADSILASLMPDGSLASWENPGEIIRSYPGGLKSFITPSRGGTGVQLPWPIINSTLCGLQPGDLMLVSGRPSHGKSVAAMQLSYEAAKSGHGVAYFSLEMSRESLVRRLISMVGKVDSQRMRLGYLNADERERVSLAASEIESLPIWIDNRGYTTPAIRRALKSLRARREIGLVVVDHFHLIQSIGREEDRQRFARTADDFQRYAKEFNIPFVVLAQLNRKCEDENRAPGLSDLGETGKLEQNADIVMFTYRPEAYARNRNRDELRGHAEFIVAKQRNGPTGKVDMFFRKEFQCFAEAHPGKPEAGK
jgi:replicative DNA helicase